VKSYKSNTIPISLLNTEIVTILHNFLFYLNEIIDEIMSTLYNSPIS